MNHWKPFRHFPVSFSTIIPVKLLFLGEPEIAEKWMCLWHRSCIMMSNWAWVLRIIFGLVLVKHDTKWTVGRMSFIRSALLMSLVISLIWTSHTKQAWFCCVLGKYSVNYVIVVRDTYVSGYRTSWCINGPIYFHLAVSKEKYVAGSFKVKTEGKLYILFYMFDIKVKYGVL